MPAGEGARLAGDIGSFVRSAFASSAPPASTPARPPSRLAATPTPVAPRATAAHAAPSSSRTTSPRPGVAELPNGDAQPFGFTGYMKDAESGLYYARARYYDPEVARFTTEDPFAGRDMEPPSLHRYLYAYANPLAYTDPTGRSG